MLLNLTRVDDIGKSLKEDKTLFYNCIEQTFTDLGPEVFPNLVKYNGKLFDKYKQAFLINCTESFLVLMHIMLSTAA